MKKRQSFDKVFKVKVVLEALMEECTNILKFDYRYTSFLCPIRITVIFSS